MKIDRNKFDLALARACKSATDLRKVFSPQTILKIRNDPDYQPTPKTVGRLAVALGVDVTDLIKEEA